MAGLVQQNMFNHGKELAKMRQSMPEKTRQAFDRVVLAGKKVLYSRETRGMIDKFMQTEAPIAEKLGCGIANVVIMIDNQANGHLPKDVIIPAATVLLFDAADFLKQTGEQISTQDIGKAYEMMFYGIYSGYGIKPEQLDATLTKMGENHKQQGA